MRHQIMDLRKYAQAAYDEIECRRLGPTQQYLGVHRVVRESDVPKIERIDTDRTDNILAFYFPLEGVNFFLEIHVRKDSAEVDSVWIEDGCRAYLTATSASLSYAELTAGLRLAPLAGWSIGDEAPQSRRYKFSHISVEPTPCRAYPLEAKLALLLDELEKDPEGVELLKRQADNTYISVCRYQYVAGNAGLHFEARTIQRIANLGLALDIDAYIQGTPFG